MVKIAICDDQKPVREYLKILTQKYINSEVSLFEKGEKLLEHTTEFDIILLDISLSQQRDPTALNGVEVAKRIRETSDAIIIFVTALKEYVFDVFDVGAFHYLLKPINEVKFKEVIQKAAKQVQKADNQRALVIKTGSNYVKVQISNIVYAENAARKIILHTKNMKENSYSFYEKMDVLERKLGKSFFRSHRGFLVNLSEVSRYDKANIFLKNGEKVYLSKQKYNDFVTTYMNYLREA